MGRAPCCDKSSVKRGPWSPEEDAKLKEFIDNYGTGGNWIALPQKAGLKRCGKSCRLRWLNYLRPNIKHGEFSEDEDRIICTLFATIGSRWSVIAAQLPGRTDNDIKNYWNTKLKKKLMSMVESTHLKNPQHDHDHQPNNFSSFLHQPSPYNYNPATAAPRPTLDLESSSIYFMHQETFPTPMQNYQKTLMFDGGDQAISSSSSDGSQMDHHYNAYSYFNGGSDHQVHGTHKLSPINGFGPSEAATTTLDYDGLEEIKQLISTNSSGNIVNNNVNNFLLPESRTAEERMLLYY